MTHSTSCTYSSKKNDTTKDNDPSILGIIAYWIGVLFGKLFILLRKEYRYYQTKNQQNVTSAKTELIPHNGYFSFPKLNLFLGKQDIILMVVCTVLGSAITIGFTLLLLYIYR